jgi:hypothetical protein
MDWYYYWNMPSPEGSRRISLSYRREEAGFQADLLVEALTNYFGEGVVVEDVESMQPGDDLVETVTAVVASCDTLLVLIGNRWLTITDAEGKRRIDDSQDVVRLEIEAAIAGNVRVIPVLIEGASMPSVGELPASLAELARGHASVLRHDHLRSDVEQLVAALQTTLNSGSVSVAAGLSAPKVRGREAPGKQQTGEQIKRKADTATASDPGKPVLLGPAGESRRYPAERSSAAATSRERRLPARIFISYRREETSYPAGWLFDRLTEHFGADQVFKDVNSIDLGDDFVHEITRAVRSCAALLALIGERWATITDEFERRRLDNPEDFVRLELEVALTRNIRVIPVLVDNAQMPRSDQLPSTVAKLARLQALNLSPTSFTSDTARLIKVLDRTLAGVRNR